MNSLSFRRFVQASISQVTNERFVTFQWHQMCKIAVSLFQLFQPFLVPNKTSSLKLSSFVTRDITGHVTIGITMHGFLHTVSV